MIQPIISCDGRLLSPLFILQKANGMFGPRVEENLFRPIMLFVLLIDSWSGHCPDIVSNLTSAKKRINTIIIPKDITRKIQPLDIYGFGIWKNFAKKFSDIVLLLETIVRCSWCKRSLCLKHFFVKYHYCNIYNVISIINDINNIIIII
ncbi:hypothetical protein P5V15_011359 [Pogonomyrmex californicus]